ncbi:MAG: TIGR00730 family Rossman fold protein [Reichenbachiella sp.]
MINSICIYCGSSSGNNPKFEEAAIELGKTLATEKIKLVYGGAKIGLMGAVSNAVLKNGGEVIGVIPKFLDHVEISNNLATELIVTETMHQRKTIMAEKADAFVALPGGMGTLEEIAEILTWSQLGLVNSPIAFLNLEGYFDHLIALFEHMNKNGLLKKEHLDLFICADSVEQLMLQLNKFESSKSHIGQKLDLT